MEIIPLVMNLVAVLFICALVTACTTDLGLVKRLTNRTQKGNKPSKAQQYGQYFEWCLVAIPFVVLLWCAYELYTNGPSRLGADGWAATFALILIFVTAHQALYARRQWGPMRQQLEQMHLDQRAWIGALDMVLTDLREDAPTYCTFTIKNTGKTPGTIEKFKDVVRVDVPGGDPLWNVEKAVEALPYGWYDTQMVVPPGAELKFPIESSMRRPRQEIEDIQCGILPLAVVVAIDYRDVTGTLRTTQCAFRYDYTEDGLVPHQEHNKMT